MSKGDENLAEYVAKISDSMEEDDTIVLVVNEGNELMTKLAFPFSIKSEPFVEDNTESQSQEVDGSSPPHSQETWNAKDVYDTVGEGTIKTEVVDDEEYEIEYLEDMPEWTIEESQSDHNKDVDSYNLEYEDNEPEEMVHKNKTRRKKTHKNEPVKKRRSRKPQERSKKSIENITSYVQQLREEYPEMADDDELLTEHLSAIMRKTKPPDPPKKFCRIIDVGEGKGKYECMFCDEVNYSVGAASRHYQYIHGDPYLICFACGFSYTNTPNLYKHEKRCTAPDISTVLRARGRYLGRKGRGRPYTTPGRFITGKATVKKDRLFCSKCPASFVQHYNLEAHENSHEGRRPFRCHLCPMAYPSQPQLKRHVKLHGDFKFICDHCGQKFKLKPALISHLDTHRLFRKHPCQYCERRFAQKTALLHHTNKTHLKLPAAHGCPVCPKRYARLSHVKEHMDRVHGLTMITRKMYYQAFPALSDAEVERTKYFFNLNPEQFASNQPQQTKDVKPIVHPKYLTPDKYKEAAENGVIIIKNKNTNEYITAEIKKSDENFSTNDDLALLQVKEEPADPKPNEENKSNRLKDTVPKSDVQINEFIERQFSNIEDKRPANSVSETEESDHEMFLEIENDNITIETKRTAADTQPIELNEEPILELNNETDISEETDENSDDLSEKITLEDIVPDKDKPKNLEEFEEQDMNDTTDDDNVSEIHKTNKNVPENKGKNAKKYVPILRRSNRMMKQL